MMLMLGLIGAIYGTKRGGSHQKSTEFFGGRPFHNNTSPITTIISTNNESKLAANDVHSDHQLRIGCLGQIWHFGPTSEYKNGHSPLGCRLVAPSLLQRCIWDPYGAFGHVLRGWKANLTGHRCACACSVHSAVALCKHSGLCVPYVNYFTPQTRCPTGFFAAIS